MKLLVGYDGSNSSKEALNLAKKNGKLMGAKVFVVASMEKGTDNDEIDTANKHLVWAKENIEEGGLSCETHLLIRGNSPGEDLVKFAEDYQVDEIIVGVKRRSKVGKILMGSTAQFVILQAHCPVLTVK